MNKIKGPLAIFCVGAALGVFTFSYVAFEARWLYTESDFNRALAQQHVIDLADVCGAIGVREWAEDKRDFDRLRGWGNTQLRRSYAGEILMEMKLEKGLRDRIRARCATQFTET